MNAPFQGSAADLIKKAMIDLERGARARDSRGAPPPAGARRARPGVPGSSRREGRRRSRRRTMEGARSARRAAHGGRRDGPELGRGEVTGRPALESLESRMRPVLLGVAAMPRRGRRRARAQAPAPAARRGAARSRAPHASPRSSYAHPLFRRARRGAEARSSGRIRRISTRASPLAPCRPSPRDGTRERGRRRRAAAQGPRRAARRARSPLAVHAREEGRTARCDLGDATSSTSRSRSRRASSRRSTLEALRKDDPLVPSVPRHLRRRVDDAAIPRDIEPKDPGAVSIEDVDVLPVAEKTPWSFDAARQ